MSKRLPILVLVLLALAAVAYWVNTRPRTLPEPSAPGYYTGPMKGKGAAATVAPEQFPPQIARASLLSLLEGHEEA